MHRPKTPAEGHPQRWRALLTNARAMSDCILNATGHRELVGTPNFYQLHKLFENLRTCEGGSTRSRSHHCLAQTASTTGWGRNLPGGRLSGFAQNDLAPRGARGAVRECGRLGTGIDVLLAGDAGVGPLTGSPELAKGLCCSAPRHRRVVQRRGAASGPQKNERTESGRGRSFASRGFGLWGPETSEIAGLFSASLRDSSTAATWSLGAGRGRSYWFLAPIGEFALMNRAWCSVVDFHASFEGESGGPRAIDVASW